MPGDSSPRRPSWTEGLWEHGLLRHSLEIIDPAYDGLSTDEERDVARQRLHDSGFR